VRRTLCLNVSQHPIILQGGIVWSSSAVSLSNASLNGGRATQVRDPPPAGTEPCKFAAHCLASLASLSIQRWPLCAQGGCVFSVSGATASGSTFAACRSSFDGGGIYSIGVVSTVATAFADCAALGGSGGAVFSSATPASPAFSIVASGCSFARCSSSVVRVPARCTSPPEPAEQA
jgi:hypothetical protein